MAKKTIIFWRDIPSQVIVNKLERLQKHNCLNDF
ncbi:MAG: hypothetical protein Ct9H300mP21_05850 [Pseudomonadota bacterium]|nr:MAG: hypothetical protein Ct9H300mP21_05850 [Pseudomonadota bacterium]